MNPLEQRRRHTAVSQLAADTEVVIAEIVRGIEGHRKVFDEFQEFSVGQLVKHDERLSLVAERLKGIDARFDAMNALTFWQRFRWLFLGR